MKFASSTIAFEVSSVLAPLSRLKLQALDIWCLEQGLGEVIVTDCVRTLGEMQRIYLPQVKTAIRKAQAGDTLTNQESRWVAETLGMDEAELAEYSKRAVDSWHLYATAWDIRIIHWSPLQQWRVRGWILKHCPGPKWETIFHPHGTGPHFHVALRDHEWKRQYAKG